MRLSGFIAAFCVALLAFAVLSPCIETACPSACCDEVAPTQQVTVMVQPSVPAQISLAEYFMRTSSVRCQRESAFMRTVTVTDPLVSRLRV